MFAFRSRSAVIRVQALRRPLGVCSVLPRSNFSVAALLRQGITEATSTSNPGTEAANPDADSEPRIPLSIQSVWYRPFRRKAEFGLPVCNLQIRSYSVRNLEFMCDFALRAAYYLNLPASGPVPLPRKTERWTVPRGHFVHKKSQENFERVTYKRLIQIKDGHPETVEIWLAYLKKHQFYGTGMKANVWGFEELGVGKRMNVSLDNLRDVATKPKWAHSGVGKTLETAERAAEILNSPEYRALADKTNIEEAERELLQAASLKTMESLNGASEAEVNAAIQKVEEEAMKAEESKEEAEINAAGQIVDEAAELEEEPTEFEAQPIEEVKVESQSDPLGPSPTIEEVPVKAASPAAQVVEQSPVAQTEAAPSEAKEATDIAQDPSADQAEQVTATFTPAETLTAATTLAADAPKDPAPEEPLVDKIGTTPSSSGASATAPVSETPETAAEEPLAEALGTPTPVTETSSVVEETKATPEAPVAEVLADTTEAPSPVVEEVKDIPAAPVEEALAETTETPLPIAEESKAAPEAQVEKAPVDTAATTTPVVEEGNDTPAAPAEELSTTPTETASSPASEAQPPTEQAKEPPEATPSQGTWTGLSETAAPASEAELQPETTEPPQVNTAQAIPEEVIEAQKAEDTVEQTEIKKAAEETAADETTREDAGEKEKKD